MPDLIGPHHQGDPCRPGQAARERLDEVKGCDGLDTAWIAVASMRSRVGRAGRQELADCLPGGRGFSDSDMTFLGGEDRCDFRDWVHEL